MLQCVVATARCALKNEPINQQPFTHLKECLDVAKVNLIVPCSDERMADVT